MAPHHVCPSGEHELPKIQVAVMGDTLSFCAGRSARSRSLVLQGDLCRLWTTRSNWKRLVFQ